MTLAIGLIKKLQAADQLKSLLVFTGRRTAATIRVSRFDSLSPGSFRPRKPVEPQRALLPEA